LSEENIEAVPSQKYIEEQHEKEIEFRTAQMGINRDVLKIASFIILIAAIIILVEDCTSMVSYILISTRTSIVIWTGEANINTNIIGWFSQIFYYFGLIAIISILGAIILLFVGDKSENKKEILMTLIVYGIYCFSYFIAFIIAYLPISTGPRFETGKIDNPPYSSISGQTYYNFIYGILLTAITVAVLIFLKRYLKKINPKSNLPGGVLIGAIILGVTRGLYTLVIIIAAIIYPIGVAGNIALYYVDLSFSVIVYIGNFSIGAGWLISSQALKLKN